MLSLNQNHLYQRCFIHFQPRAPNRNDQQVSSSFCDSIQITQGYLCGLLIGQQDPLESANIAGFVHCINADLPLRPEDQEIYQLMSGAIKHELGIKHLNLFIASAQEEPNAAIRCLQIVNIAYGLLLGLNCAHINTGPCSASGASATPDSTKISEQECQRRNYHREFRKLAELFPSPYLAHRQIDVCAEHLQELVQSYFSKEEQQEQRNNMAIPANRFSQRTEHLTHHV